MGAWFKQKLGLAQGVYPKEDTELPTFNNIILSSDLA